MCPLKVPLPGCKRCREFTNVLAIDMGLKLSIGPGSEREYTLSNKNPNAILSLQQTIRQSSKPTTTGSQHLTAVMESDQLFL